MEQSRILPFSRLILLRKTNTKWTHRRTCWVSYLQKEIKRWRLNWLSSALPRETIDATLLVQSIENLWQQTMSRSMIDSGPRVSGLSGFDDLDETTTDDEDEDEKKWGILLNFFRRKSFLIILYNNGSHRNEDDLPYWDIFQTFSSKSKSSSMVENKLYEVSVQLTKCLVFLILFVIVLCASVTSTLTTLFFTSSLKDGNRRIPFCDKSLGD